MKDLNKLNIIRGVISREVEISANAVALAKFDSEEEKFALESASMIRRIRIFINALIEENNDNPLGALLDFLWEEHRKMVRIYNGGECDAAIKIGVFTDIIAIKRAIRLTNDVRYGLFGGDSK